MKISGGRESMKYKSIIGFISLSIIIGYIIGFTLSANNIILHHFFQHKMYRLIAVSVQQFLNKWVLLSVCCGIVIVVAIFSLKLLWKVISETILIQIKNTRLFKAIALGIGCTAIFAYCLRQIHLFYLQDKAQILRLMVYFLLLITVALSGWLLFKLKINIIYKILNLKILRGAFVCLIAALILLNLGIYVDGKFNTPTGPNIIMIVVDCLRADHLGCYGYGRNTSPTIDKLAAQGIVFNNAYSNAPWTYPSITSILTSLLPNIHNINNLNDKLPNKVLTLPEVLKNNGYYTMCFNGGNPNFEQNLVKGFDALVFQDIMPEYQQALNYGRGLTDDFLSHLKKMHQKKFFAWIHYMDTHTIYHKNEFNNLFTKHSNSFLEAGSPNLLPKQIRMLLSNNMLSQIDMQYIEALYDGQIKYVDKNIEKIITALKENNIYNNTVIILTADHGEEFFDHNNFGHGHSLYNEVLHIPLIISGSEIRNTVINDYVSLIDLYPSILAIAGIEKNRGLFLQGSSFIKNPDRFSNNLTKSVFATSTWFGAEKYCVILNNNKLIFNTVDEENKAKLYGYKSKDKSELYDLSVDRKEKLNLATKDSKTLIMLHNELEKYVNVASKEQKTNQKVDDDTIKKLKSFGYIQ